MRYWKGLKVPVEPKKEWKDQFKYPHWCAVDPSNVNCTGISCDECIYSFLNFTELEQFYKESFPEKPKKLPKRDSKGRFCSSYKAPKLTEEVFNKPNCPKWAQWAAVDGSGKAYWYRYRPRLLEGGSPAWVCSAVEDFGGYVLIEQSFDSSDWENSLIERPKKAPEIGFYYSPSKSLYYYYYVGLNKDPYKARICGSNGDYEALPTDAYRIKKQSYSEEELIGKVVKTIKGYTPAYYVITCAAHGLIDLGACECPVEKSTLELDYTFLDGSPCFKVLPQ